MGLTRKATVAAALGAATVLGIAGPAFADDCINLSRPYG
jgi:hypothetical protein